MHISIKYRNIEHYSCLTGHYFQVTPSEINASVTNAVYRFLELKYPHREIFPEEIVIKRKSRYQSPTVTKEIGKIE